MKNISKALQLKQSEDYLKFLKKKLLSKNFKNNVSADEYEKTKRKYEKAKLLLKYLQES